MIFLMFVFIFEILFGGFIPHGLLPGTQANVFYSNEAARESSVRFSGVKFRVEMAQTAAERSRGLMFRESMLQDQGMLFIFDDEVIRSFWMKNTLIPLDMIFVDRDGKVVSVSENIQPCREKDSLLCPTYSSVLPARYVLEINAGLAQFHHIQAGSRMDIFIP